MRNTKNNSNSGFMMNPDTTEKKEQDLMFLLTPEAVEEIREMQELDSNGYHAYSKAIDKIFFNYIGICMAEPNRIGIDNTDVFCISQVKRILELLEQGRQLNNNLTT
ncbi:hypothetical protein [Chryseobacterium sp. T20]|uniref:hypothetical protein n=1 Tax=Chryseobacterium sp. T20 TaxID=3395375 RepID=UPI0039BD5753